MKAGSPLPSPAPDHSRRDALIAIACGLGVLGFIVYGIMSMGSKQQEASRATLTGKIVSKSFKPAPEEQISFGRKGLRTEKIAGEFLLKVHVERENRTFEVPVPESTYHSVDVGDNFTFGRPPSELQSPAPTR